MGSLEKRELPTGLGGKELSQNKEVKPAVKIANEVIWINPDAPEMPFRFELGKSSQLGLFFLSGKNRPNKGVFNIEIKQGHGRSGILGRLVFKDKFGNLYRDIDIKGLGYVSFLSNNLAPHILINRGADTRGVLNLDFAKSDIEMAGEFLRAGIRTHLPLALIKLKEILGQSGSNVSLGEAKRGRAGDLAKYLKSRDNPVLEIRAFGTRSRIDDLSMHLNDPLNTLNDARVMVAQELGIDSTRFPENEYANWFIDTMAKNVARMHAHGWIHGYLSGHNITLDARIVDLDSVETLADIKKTGRDRKKNFNNDIISSILSIWQLVGRLKDVPISIEHLGQSFYSKYASELKRKNPRFIKMIKSFDDIMKVVKE